MSHVNIILVGIGKSFMSIQSKARLSLTQLMLNIKVCLQVLGATDACMKK